MDSLLVASCILGGGIIVFLLLSVATRRLCRMLIYFTIANLFLFGLLAAYGMGIIASIVLLVNLGVVAVFIFLAMNVGEVMEAEGRRALGGIIMFIILVGILTMILLRIPTIGISIGQYSFSEFQQLVWPVYGLMMLVIAIISCVVLVASVFTFRLSEEVKKRC